ncbi:MAG: hypothetical protein JWM87_2091 [Candidatus Eremiobacteraeota bacterium]|nr:hypothetical protein [Candidatus Eremiobacteraeota bacterium]
MGRIMAVALIVIFSLLGTRLPAAASAAVTCTGPQRVSINVGESKDVTVRGPVIPTAAPTPGPVAVIQSLKQQQTIEGQTFPAGTRLIGQPTPTPTPAMTPTPGADAPLSGRIEDIGVASIATAVPTAAPNGNGLVQLQTTFSVKGEAQGNTVLTVSQGANDCANTVAIAVRPKDRFLVTTGIGFSSIPKTTFTTLTSTPAPAVSPAPPPPNPPPGKYVFETEQSGRQTSIPLLGNYRINDAPKIDLYLTLGYFASGDNNGPVLGVSAGRGQLLFTVGIHSANVTALSPFVNPATHRIEFNGAASTIDLPGTVSTRRTGLFLALTVPPGLIGDILGGKSK